MDGCLRAGGGGAGGSDTDGDRWDHQRRRRRGKGEQIELSVGGGRCSEREETLCTNAMVIRGLSSYLIWFFSPSPSISYRRESAVLNPADVTAEPFVERMCQDQHRHRPLCRPLHCCSQTCSGQRQSVCSFPQGLPQRRHPLMTILLLLPSPLSPTVAVGGSCPRPHPPDRKYRYDSPIKLLLSFKLHIPFPNPNLKHYLPK